MIKEINRLITSASKTDTQDSEMLENLKKYTHKKAVQYRELLGRSKYEQMKNSRVIGEKETELAATIKAINILAHIRQSANTLLDYAIGLLENKYFNLLDKVETLNPVEIKNLRRKQQILEFEIGLLEKDLAEIEGPPEKET
jgi:hypothetical protein